MNLAYSLVEWQALAPGLASRDVWQRWAQQPPVLDPNLPVAKPQFLPMMTARRLSSGSRAAVECGLALLARQPADAVVFTSRHGELERNLRILTALAEEQALSPTDFAMSVHNSAVGSLTIAAQQPLVSTSISAGIDSFQQGLIEVTALHQAGYKKVLLVDFEGAIPDYYSPWLPECAGQVPYAVGLVLAVGDSLRCSARLQTGKLPVALPQSLAFLHGMLSDASEFILPGARMDWQWEKSHG
ncbi:MAG: beta-ketoacyl synthase chain length factor [Pantoea sp.]|uniref:beta-ketoacyl synthase chain length factor n=1 Tax=Pantoea TaxID=53335 RepID=UPI000F895C26|nr:MULTISPECIES: beta-ketoacyl synthase chain length factor [Pantoea]MDU6431753.1 beta-ketoacyl synthase chain length factor [Pantoea sp.]RTY59937.1 beta-ketoacyl synthase [Pantoea sp. YU22]WBV20316.1 beta-ketoacyl synthase chain length factor [Pantoea piersonii]